MWPNIEEFWKYIVKTYESKNDDNMGREMSRERTGDDKKISNYNQRLYESTKEREGYHKLYACVIYQKRKTKNIVGK